MAHLLLASFNARVSQLPEDDPAEAATAYDRVREYQVSRIYHRAACFRKTGSITAGLRHRREWAR